MKRFRSKVPFKDPEAQKAYYLEWRRKYRLRESFKVLREKRLAACKEWRQKNYRRKITGEPGDVRYEAKLLGFKSGFERTVATQLRTAKIPWAYEDTKIPYTLEGHYNPDFHLLKSGIFIEAKGLLDKEAKRKMVAVKKQHPELDIRLLFMVADKKIPGSKQTHAQWAEKNGFKWAEGAIPEEWLLEQNPSN